MGRERYGPWLIMLSGCLVDDPLYGSADEPSTDSGRETSTTSTGPSETDSGSSGFPGSSTTNARPVADNSTNAPSSAGPTTDLGSGPSSSDTGREPDSPCWVFVSDEFDGDALGSAWRPWNPNSADSVTEADGVLSFHFNGVPDEKLGFTVTDRPIDAGYVQLQLAAFPEPGSDDRLFLTIEAADCQMGFVMYDGEYRLRSELGEKIIPYASAEHGPFWIRNRLDADSFFWEISDDGASWVVIDARQACDLSQSEIHLFAHSGTNTESTTPIAVESFELCIEN